MSTKKIALKKPKAERLTKKLPSLVKPIKLVVQQVVPEVIHWGSTRPACGARGRTQYALMLPGAVRNVTCKKCLELFEEVFFDQLYGTTLEEDDTTP